MQHMDGGVGEGRSGAERQSNRGSRGKQLH